MQNEIDPAERARHLRITEPSPWVARFARLAPENAEVLDVAAGADGEQARAIQAEKLDPDTLEPMVVE